MSIRRPALLAAVCLSILLHAALWMLLAGPRRIDGPALAPRVLEARFIAARDAAPALEAADRSAPRGASPAAAAAVQPTPAPAARRSAPAAEPHPPTAPADASAVPRAARSTRSVSTSMSAPAEPPPPPPAPPAGTAPAPSAPAEPHDRQTRAAAQRTAAPAASQGTTVGAVNPPPAGSAAVDPDATDLDVPPRPLSEVAPVYPPAAGIRSGEVVLDLSIDAMGLVRNVTVVSATLPGWFEASATEAFLRTRFSPGLRDGRPTAARMRVAVVYSASGVSLGGGAGGAR